jgi:starch synthase
VDDLAAALVDAVSDAERARRFGEAGRRRAVEQFSWEAIGDQTLEVYDKALAAP